MILNKLPLREREVARIILSRGEASADEIRAALTDPLSNAAVRSMLRRLEAKGVVRRHKDGKKFLYALAGSERIALEAVLLRVSRDYFGGSLAEMAQALIEMMESDPATAQDIRPRLRRIRRRAAAAQKAPTIQKVTIAANAAAA